ncbi:SUMF1/EgtB/PvdO family nonheme iron enzyme [Flavobacterium sp.]|uniref:SUMF1/EgtB/PvdO family nonheme iron enzyme n=1 Tax=Flavobacterium sp. TaxID=239 RepID=UPI0011FDACA9|nr:SUMF1/EgtB/PvdO family nonheme iron enzyme [Flavobacterium sp.]RZJ73541.1 MAG: hypothetical protein EOO49_01630 [Flavobacterium sp.]
MKTRTLFFSFFFIGLLSIFSVNKAAANNLQITGTSVSGTNITFNIAWDNSWNANVAPANWDAVWVFVKYQDCNTRLWAHTTLSTVAGDHSAASPLMVETVTDGKGVFIRRSALGGGNVGATQVTLKMNLPAGTFNYKVFGIEMVNVPQAAFELGDGQSSGTFNSITINASSQSTGLTSSVLGGGAVAAPATFPMGYNSFYCMKYEISQLQYVEFLNALTYDQQKAHTVNDPISPAGTYAMYGGFAYRNGVRIQTPGNNAAIPAVFACDATSGVENNSDDGQGTAMNGLNWGDLAAYLDWAALRPMTEMEYEKVTRGTMQRIAGEYAWGSTDLANVASNALANQYLENEYMTPAANGRCTLGVGTTSTIYGSVRVGAFATGTSGRASSGAAYYGAMEMTGNVWERVVCLASAAGSAFNGTLGDGTITANGDANQNTWPTAAAATGSGQRGGGWIDGVAAGRLSQRNTGVDAARYPTYGGRGVR